MIVLYNLAIRLYFLLVALASPVHHRARRFVRSRRMAGRVFNTSLKHQGQWIWFHTSSLGEFEQARPVIEAVRKDYGQYKLLITFYSPSGYEVRSTYEGANLVTYLPIDTQAKVKAFVDLFDFKLVCIVKTDLWLNHLRTLNNRGVPVINLAAQFRNDQLFFRPWAAFYRSFLNRVDHMVVINQQSMGRLQSVYRGDITVAGDTRFDGVLDLNDQRGDDAFMTELKRGRPTVIFASVWDTDLQMITPLIEEIIQAGVFVIMVPHEVDPGTIGGIERTLKSTIRYSSKNLPVVKDAKAVLVVDTVGDLARLYGYADLAYVGGAFRGYLHNIMEPAAYGIPVIFGKDARNEKFPEAGEMVNLKVAIEAQNTDELSMAIHNLLEDDTRRETMGTKAVAYIREHSGATQKTMEVIKTYLA